MVIIWGLKTIAMFDVWTFEHILSGLSVGSAVRDHNKKHFHKLANYFHPSHKTGGGN